MFVRLPCNTLTSQSELQISFLKDLVSLRNPTSPYSFVNYLSTRGRLLDFINLGTFYPSRMEFNDYLRWVASNFAEQCRYDEEVLSVEPIVVDGQVDALRVTSRGADGEEVSQTARSLVVSAGGTAAIPELFKDLRGDARVFHHSQYLPNMAKQPCAEGKPMRIAVVGGGQSSAEAFIDLNDSYPSVQVDYIMRGGALKPADSSPFVNEIFGPEYTDMMYNQPQDARERFLDEYYNTNYAVVDPPLIDRIYDIFYRQKVSGEQRHQLLRNHLIDQAVATEEGIELTVRQADGEAVTRKYDAVILATGYERRQHIKLLAPLAEYLGDCVVDRNYRVQTDARCKAAIYLQGANEASHGLSDTLLSILPVRSEEIANALYEYFQSEIAEAQSEVA